MNFELEETLFYAENEVANLADEDLMLPKYWRRPGDVRRMAQKSGVLENFKQIAVTPINDRVGMIREMAIKNNGVSIVPLVGMEMTFDEYLRDKREYFDFEPDPNFYREVISNIEIPIKSMEVSVMGKNRIWGYLEETAARIQAETGREVDLNFLTPYEAVFVISKLISERFNYEYLAVPDAEKNVSPNLKTSRPDLIELAKNNPSKFAKETEKLSDKIDKQTGDQLFDSRFMVCRHIAQVSSLIYEILKERQVGILLNGTYLIYHSELFGNQKMRMQNPHHSYNVLAVTAMNRGEKEIAVSVLDTSFFMETRVKLDYSWLRLSQACSFLNEFGERLNIKNVKEKVECLADQATQRMEKFFTRENLKMSKLREKGIDPFWNDYVSLCFQSSLERKGMVFDHLWEMCKAGGMTKEEMLLRCYETPSIASTIWEEPSIYTERSVGFNKLLSEIKFSKKEPLHYVLWDLLNGDLSTKNIDWLKHQISSKREIGDDGIQILVMAGYFMRACVAMDCIPDNENIDFLCEVMKYEEKFGCKEITLKVMEEFIDLVLEHNRRK